jgi:Archaeal fructose-1,6-bisphosphatase and related enzymes of inositol monophosphatase family
MLAQVLKEAVTAGAAQLTYYFNNPELKTAYKEGGVNDLVTEADHAADKAIIEVIRSYYPDHFIL